MKLNKNYLYGAILVILGIVLGLSELGFITFNIFFEGWWTLFLIIPGIVDLCTEKNKKASAELIGLGVLLLLIARNIITFELLLKLIIPVIIIGIGVNMLLDKK